MERRLGRGLGSLLSQAPSDPRTGTQEIELRRIRPNPHQPRTTFDPEALEELVQSIREHGILQPIVVRPSGDGFELVAGERRWRASRLAGRETIPALVRRDVGDEQMLELALVENVQRDDLDPIEKAKGFVALQAQLGLSQDQVAAKVGLQRSTVANHVRLLDLPEDVQAAVSRGLLTMGHARALLGLPDARAQRALMERIGREELSVRAVESLVRAQRPAPSAAPAAEPEAPAEPAAAPPPWTRDLERRLQEALGTRVRLSSDADCRGQLVIDFYDRPTLERLLDRLAPAQPV